MSGWEAGTFDCQSDGEDDEPEGKGDEHGPGIANGGDVYLGSDDAPEDHGYPCCEKEGWHEEGS
jgi:hypothetical protein